MLENRPEVYQTNMMNYMLCCGKMQQIIEWPFIEFLYHLATDLHVDHRFHTLPENL